MSVQTQRTLVLNILVLYRTVSISKMEEESNDNAYSQADREEHSIGRKADQHRDHDYCSNRQSGGAFYVNRGAPEHRNNNKIVVRRRKLV